MYVDQVKSDLSEFDPTGRLKTLANGRMAAEYDTRFGYRVMEALRNVAQHQALPVQMVSYPHETRGEYLRIRVIPGLMVSHLASTDMKAPILEELKSKANRDVVQITPLVRDYLEGLGAVHKAVRKEMADDLAVAESFMTQTLADCAARWPGSFGCDVWEEEGEARTGFEVFKGLAEARRRASDNVGTFDGLSRLFVSGELDDPK
jgi:hypothetical protein